MMYVKITVKYAKFLKYAKLKYAKYVFIFIYTQFNNIPNMQ